MSLDIMNQFDFNFLDIFKKIGDYKWGAFAGGNEMHSYRDREHFKSIRDQSRMDFEGADFSGLTLQNFSFKECNLRNTNFSRSNLKGTDFNSSIIRNSDFDQTNLELAVLAGGDLSGSVFKNANLDWADLRDANLSKCDFSNCSLETVIINDDTNFYGATFNENTILPFEFDMAFKKHMKLI